MNLKKSLNEIARNYGIDYFGVAPINRWDNAPEGHRPQDLLPTAKSAISMGIKIRKAAKHANQMAYRGFNMAIAIYMNFGFRILNSLLDQAAYFVHRELLERHYDALPIPAAHPYPYIADVIFKKTRSANLFSNRHAAVTAGNAEFGWNTLALTEDAGPRVRWVTVITSAELEPDRLREPNTLCKAENCPAPLACAKVCPMKALSLKESVNLVIEGVRVSYSKLDMTKCLWGICGLRKATLGKYDCHMPEVKSLEDFYKALGEKDLMENLERLGDGSMCGRCIVECPIGE